MFKQILIALMLTIALSGMEVFARALNNDGYLQDQDMEQKNPTQTRNKRFLDDLLDAMIDWLFEYDDEDDYDSKENDGVQSICKNCAVIVNNVNHINLPTPSSVGKPNPQPPALNEDKTKDLTGRPNSEVTQNPNTQTTQPATEETKPTPAAINQIAGEPTAVSTPKVVDGTAIKPNEDAEVANTTTAPMPEAAVGADML